MKIIALVAFLGLLAVAPVTGQSTTETTRQYLIEKLVFYYIDDPTQPFPAAGPARAALEIDKVSISNNQDITSPLWTNTNNSGLKTVMKALLCTAANGGDVRLQSKVRNVLLITDKKVYVYLYNDFANGTPDASMPIYCTYDSGPKPKASWPCANYFSNRSLEATGHIGIGAFFFHSTTTAGGWTTTAEKRSVFIHELMHTQSPLATVDYGNGGHSFSEMLPGRNSAFDEGMANAFAFRYVFPDWAQMTAWFNNDNSLFVDNITGCPAGSTNGRCLIPRLTAASVSPLASCANGDQCYSIRAVPANIIMHCENVPTNVLYQYMQQFRSDIMFVRDVKRAATDLQTCAHPGTTHANYNFGHVFKQMVKSGNNYSNPNKPAGTRTHGQFMPVAILDYYTGYKIQNKATLESALGITWDSTLPNIDDYFSTHRNTLLGFRASATSWDVNQLNRLAEHLNVRNSTTASAPANTPAASTGGGN